MISVDGKQLLSEITTFSKYARYLPELKRRESWDEICDRYEKMMITKYFNLKAEIIEAVKLIRNKKILPSMRMLQFAGTPIERNEARGYNCSYLPIDNYRAFDETMFLLLSGCGVGFSVQKHHIEQLPQILPKFKADGKIKERKYLVSDSLEGWGDAIKTLMKSYFGMSNSKPKFDFSDIRAKGVRLVTSGGKAPGPFPLQYCLFNIEQILEQKDIGSKLTTIECYDIICHIANAVLAGGIRRSALICLFDFDDESMISSKSGSWWELHPQRGRSNNSAVIMRSKVKEDEFFNFWKKIEASGAGEPGIYFTNDKDYGSNPCVEISLRPNTFCNLCELNGSNIDSPEDFYNMCAKAAFLGTLQAGFTDFHYLRDIWKTNTEKDYLIGVGITGIASNKLTDEMLIEGNRIIEEVNKNVSFIIGTKPASRRTTIKPAGTTSCVLGTSSGIHAWHNDYYIRTIRVGKNESIYQYMLNVNPDLVEDDLSNNQQAIIKFPIYAGEGATTRSNISPIDQLELTKQYNINWVRKGHLKGPNYNNVSATISIKPEEWEIVGKWMWENKEYYNGLSVLPFDGGTYVQAPFQDCTKEEYEELSFKINPINLLDVIEEDDNVDLQGELACASGQCEIK